MINPNNFLIGEIPKLNPYSQQYSSFWRAELIKCLEGYWVGGKWITPTLYFFVNHWHIKISKDKSKVQSLPMLRDIDWERAYLYEEAKGFSGFEEDSLFHCNREYIETNHPSGKTYIPAREYLRLIHPKSLGRPLYENPSMNIIELGGRGYGKSYWVAACAAHVFLFDGASSYKEFKEDKPSSEVVLSAQAQDYISTLVQHTYYGLNRLRGSIQKGKDYFPPPLAKEYSGSLSPNKFLLQEKEVKKGGSWVKEGSTSKLHCRIIGDDPFVSNGTRSKLIIIDETGFVPLLEEVFGSCKATTLNDSFKFGVIWATGTGGEMEGKGSIATKKIFYDPESYDCLSFTDEWENTGKIGLFVPGYYKRNECRDENGILDIEKAKGYDLKERAKLEKSPSVVPLQIEKMNTPLVPSEVFLSKSGNKFPVNDLKAQLAYIESSTDEMLKGVIGTMIWSPETNKPEFKPDSSLREVIFPINPKNDNTGCVVIYEVPQLLPFGTYVAGIDPYAQDDTTESVSVGTCYIMKRKVLGHTTQDQIVAKYVGRPESLNVWMEQVRRLLMYYSALGLYENNYNHLKGHMELKNSLKFLANTPTVFKSSTNESKVLYGIRMTKDVKPEAELYLKNWLEEEVEEGKMNLHYILDKHLLKELIAYSDTGNFDAVIAIMLANVQRITMLKIIYKEKEYKPDPFFNRKLFRRN